MASAVASTRSRSDPLTQIENIKLLRLPHLETRLSRTRGRAREAARAEDHLAVLHHELVVQEEVHGLGQNLRLEGATTRLHLLERVLADPDVEDVLQDDRTR